MKNNLPKIQLSVSLILVCVFLFAFVYLSREINNNNQKATLGENEWQKEELRRDEIKALDRSVRVIEKERMQLETHFARSSDAVPFLDTIEGLAPKVNAKAEVTSVEILKDQSGLMVEIKASGTFSDLYRFLTLLENSPYELEFVGVEMHKGTEVGLQWNAVFKIKLLTFIQ